MIVNVANPIYDAVFKYLLEDERIAKTLLSSLLRKNVVEVEMRPHEYSNVMRDKISMFRIDFGARIREEDGSVHLVLVEIQKTWVETETLRFRQYLGAHYSNPGNMLDAGEGMVMEGTPDCGVAETKCGKYAIPMVTIYLLGHRVGDIEEPVIYVSHDVLDYYGNPVTKGIPDPFVNSLVHDSIIVQIPLLRGQVNNRLYKVLSIFDQSQKDGIDHQMLNIDESRYVDDPEMEHIVHRLLAAASNHELRMEMNVEDEYFKAIEDRDTAIMNRNTTIRKLDKKIMEQEQQLSQQEQQLSQKDELLSQQEQQLSQKDELITRQHSMLRMMVKSMASQGMGLHDISALTKLSPEDLLALLNES